MHRHVVVVDVAEEIAIVVMVTVGLIAELEIYDLFNPIGANINDRRMCEYTMLMQAALTCFILIIW